MASTNIALVPRSLSASLVTFYLNNLIFRQCAKTFSVKLQASGWNLSPFRIVAGYRVTGCFGTSDKRHQLPMLVKQVDLAELAHIEVEPHYYLMADSNREYVRMNHATRQRWTKLDLIRNLTKLMRSYKTRILSTPVRIFWSTAIKTLQSLA